MTGWRRRDMPDLYGRRALVTGGSSGIGLCVAEALCRHGAQVVLTSRDAARGAAAVAKIRRAYPGADVCARLLDLGDLASVRRLAGRIRDEARLDVLINNAGLMGISPRRLTKDGFELQLGCNHLGHFVLTLGLLPVLIDPAGRGAGQGAGRGAGRVVTVASVAHLRGEMRMDDLQMEQGYDPMAAYTQSKLANVLFALELDRRLRAAGAPVRSVAAHPGIAATGIADAMAARMPAWRGAFVKGAFGVFGQAPEKGAVPILHAATAEVEGGSYWGPDGIGEWRGRGPGPARIAPLATDAALAEALWRRSALLTGQDYPG